MSEPLSIPLPPHADARGRLLSIDALRGLVILFMLLDHVRETFYLHHQVPDPMVVDQTPPELFFSRLLAHLCAPVFVFLTGLSAFLYGAKHADGRAATSSFLWKRGLFFYVLHLYVLKFLYLGGEAVWGLNQGKFFGFSAMWMVWLASVVLAFALYPAVRAFAALKARRRDIAWLKYL